VFKAAQAKPSHAVLQELECHRCGVVLVVEVPKGDVSYQCVCGGQIDFAAMKQAA
jgi:hypothetical protein